MQFVLSSAESLYSVQSALLKSLGEDERFFDLKIKYENRLKNINHWIDLWRALRDSNPRPNGS